MKNKNSLILELLSVLTGYQGVRVASGDLCRKAEALTESADEKPPNKRIWLTKFSAW